MGCSGFPVLTALVGLLWVVVGCSGLLWVVVGCSELPVLTALVGLLPMKEKSWSTSVACVRASPSLSGVRSSSLSRQPFVCACLRLDNMGTHQTSDGRHARHGRHIFNLQSKIQSIQTYISYGFIKITEIINKTTIIITKTLQTFDELKNLHVCSVQTYFLPGCIKLSLFRSGWKL